MREEERRKRREGIKGERFSWFLLYEENGIKRKVVVWFKKVGEEKRKGIEVKRVFINVGVGEM